MTGTPSPERLQQLESRRQGIVAQARNLLEARASAVGETLRLLPGASAPDKCRRVIGELDEQDWSSAIARRR
jgi:hypothetical protein